MKNMKLLAKDDSLWDFPETFNSNMKEIENAVNSIMFDIVRIKDDIEHLKMLIRED